MNIKILLPTILLIITIMSCRDKNQVSDDDSILSPNIILIIADDMNWDDCGAYGHPSIKTPNIDKLAQDGMRFDHAYITASSCSPSRASIITGRYPHNTGAEQLHWAMPAGTHTFVKQLSENGYYTAAAGKWHMGENIRHHFNTIYEANKAGFQLPTGSKTQPPKMIAKQPSGCNDWVPVLQSRPKDKPFFMWFAALDPHRAYEQNILQQPHALSDVIVPPYLPDVQGVREDLRQYYDEISRLDSFVGNVIKEVERQDVADNTVIVFISDNGRPFPRDKTTLYEGGIKTPWIVKWPKEIKSGTVTQSLVSSVDIAPTLLDIAGITHASKGFEGVSFLPTLENPEKEIRKYVYAEDHWHDYEDHARAILNHNWKLIRNDYPDLAATPSADAGRSLSFTAMNHLKEKNELTTAQLNCYQTPRPKYELYNLEDDPFELNNLAEQKEHVSIKEELIQALTEWSANTNDFIPSKRTLDEFDRKTGQPIPTVRKRPRPDKKAMFGTYGKY